METAKSPASWHFGFSGKDMLSWRKIKAVFRICANDFTKLAERSRLPATPEYLVLEGYESVLSTAEFILPIFKLTL